MLGTHMPKIEFLGRQKPAVLTLNMFICSKRKHAVILISAPRKLKTIAHPKEQITVYSFASRLNFSSGLPSFGKFLG